MTCEMTFDGPPCGKVAHQAVGLVDPTTDAYRCVLFTCEPCLHRLMDTTSQQFRTLDTALAHRLRRTLSPGQ